MNRLKTHEEDIEIAGKHDNNQRKSCKIHWKMLERYSEGKCDNNLAGKCDNNQNKGCKICWNMEETGATATKTIGNWRRRVKLLEKYIENAWNAGNERKWYKKP